MTTSGHFAAKKAEKAPTGKWEMPDPSISAALGTFIMAWALIDSVIEVCIAKQLGLRAIDGSIVTAGLQFRSRSSLLLSLLNRTPLKNAKAIKIVKDMQGIQDRNDILHSVIGSSKSVVWFNRRKTGATFTSKIEKYDRDRLLIAALRCSELTTKLMKAQGVSNNDYSAFFQATHNEANKL
jgi:hypothetical protein